MAPRKSGRFRNRAEGGRRLATLLSAYAGRNDVVVLGLPRGGVPVAREVAQALGTPLDVLVVRKLGVPGHQELALGALASGGVRVLNDDVIAAQRLSAADIEAVTQAEQEELERRERSWREGAWRGRQAPELTGRTLVLIDDGLATGATMRAAVVAVGQHNPAAVVVAVPVAARSTVEELARQVDEVVCVLQPEPFWAVGLWYEDFAETTDAEVAALLAAAARESTPAASSSGS
jgi:putative phosphoribosyl transferase